MRSIHCGPIAALLIAGCASLPDIIQAPRFEVADRESTLRLLAPSAQHPLGAAAIRVWTRVENPNPLALTLRSLAGTFYLEDRRAATADFPLGLPLPAAQDTVIPLDFTVGFSDLPVLADVARRWFEGAVVDYRLDGTVSVDAGPLGEPSFGPMTLLTGELRVRR